MHTRIVTKRIGAQSGVSSFQRGQLSVDTDGCLEWDKRMPMLWIDYVFDFGKVRYRIEVTKRVAGKAATTNVILETVDQDKAEVEYRNLLASQGYEYERRGKKKEFLEISIGESVERYITREGD